MPKQDFVIDRRLMLKATGSLVAAATANSLLPSNLFAQTRPDAVLLTISDLHAPYARLPNLLSTIRSLRQQANAPSALLINGDVFERGNVVCLRSDGAADWAMLETLAKEMPVVINIGNHETAILDDPAEFITRAEKRGIRVISNLIDQRTDRLYAPVAHQLELGDIKVGLLGLAATNQFVYRQEVRDKLLFQNTPAYVQDAFADAMGDADTKLIMSHAGLAADKKFIDSLPVGTVLQGAHDHLDFELVHGNVRYFHGASWGTKIGILGLNKGSGGVQTQYRTQTIAAGADAGDTALAEIIAAQKTTHLTGEDRDVIADIPQSLNMHRSILVATEAVRRATQADIAMLGHTTFGAPLSKGPLTRYDFDAFVRFGGGLKVANVAGKQLAKMLARANQFAARGIEQRSGDYVHVAEVDLDANKTYRLAVNGWTAINQKAYLGTEDLAFEDIEGLELKAVIADHLSQMR